mgnify:FL=1
MKQMRGEDYEQWWESQPVFEPTARRTRSPFDRRMRQSDGETTGRRVVAADRRRRQRRSGRRRGGGGNGVVEKGQPLVKPERFPGGDRHV